MRYCKKRGKVNPPRVATSKRYLFWMIVAISAACSVLHERAAFVASWGSSERTLLQLCFWSVKDGDFTFHDLLGVFLSPPTGVISYRFQYHTKLGGRSKAGYRGSAPLVSDFS